MPTSSWKSWIGVCALGLLTVAFPGVDEDDEGTAERAVVVTWSFSGSMLSVAMLAKRKSRNVDQC